MKPKLPRGTLHKLWRNPSNWRSLGFYSCPNDPRIFVPKRIKWTGYTCNFAHPASVGTLVIGFIGSGIVIFCLSGHTLLMFSAVFLLTLHACATGWLMSSPDRYEESR